MEALIVTVTLTARRLALQNLLLEPVKKGRL